MVNTEKAESTLDWYKSLFGDDCYLEITHHPEIEGHESLQETSRHWRRKQYTHSLRT
jgi:DNA polymerase III alpha subunit